jgi:hypothetical protein
MEKYSRNALLHHVAQQAPLHHEGRMSETGELHSTRVHIMMTASELRAIEEWRRQQPDLPARAEAIRRLIQLGIIAQAPKSTR